MFLTRFTDKLGSNSANIESYQIDVNTSRNNLN